MLPYDILEAVRYITKTTSTDNTGTEIALMRSLNDYYMRQVQIFVNTNEDKFGVRASTNINVGNNQEAYALPSDCIRLKDLEVNYTGSPSEWYKARYQDVSQVESFAMSSTNINNYYSTSNPYYDVFGDSILLRPIPTTSVSGGLFLWYIQRPSLLSTLSSTITTPLDYHGYLVYGVAGEVATRQGNDALAAAMFQKWEDGRIKIETQFPPKNMDEQVDFMTYPVDYS